MKKIALCAALLALSATALGSGKFEPHKIKPGIPYYSNDYTSENNLSMLAEEKNFEEVYRNYNYYEAVFDKHERIVFFNAYKQGELEFSETYYYEESGKPVKKEVVNARGERQVVYLTHE